MQMLWPPSAHIGIQMSEREGLNRQDSCQLQNGETNEKTRDAHRQQASYGDETRGCGGMVGESRRW